VIYALRWLAIAPAIAASWFVAFATGIGLMTFAERCCPSEQMVSGACMAGWFPPVELAIYAISAALAAILIIHVATRLAPSHHTRVAQVVYAGGIASGIYPAVATGLWICLAAAAVSGALTCRAIARTERRN